MTDRPTLHCTEHVRKNSRDGWPILTKFISASKTTDLSPPSDWQVSFSQSAPAYKHASLDKPVVCPYTIVMQTNHVPALFFKWSSALGQRGWSKRYVVYFACLSGRSYWLNVRGDVNRQTGDAKTFNSSDGSHCQRFNRSWSIFHYRRLADSFGETIKRISCTLVTSESCWTFGLEYICVSELCNHDSFVCASADHSKPKEK